MFLSVFGRSHSISLFKYRAKITLVGKPCLLRNLQDAEILIVVVHPVINQTIKKKRRSLLFVI